MPATAPTGCLGAAKTALLRRSPVELHRMRFAAVLSEPGEVVRAVRGLAWS